MKSRSTSVIVAALAAMISASPAQAGGLKQVAEISIPGDPITDIGIMAIDQTTSLGYLADKTNKSVVVFDTKTDKFVSRIPGFVGRLKDGDASGPNGVVVVKGGAEVWVRSRRRGQVLYFDILAFRRSHDVFNVSAAVQLFQFKRIIRDNPLSPAEGLTRDRSR